MGSPRCPLSLLASLLLLGCAGEPDPRIAHPRDTVETLLRANHLWGATGPQPIRSPWSAEAEEPLPIPDIETTARCFWDYDRDDPDSRAMGEFVAGMLAAGQQRLAFHSDGDQAVVVSGHRHISMRRSRQGWHIVLSQSVPEEIRLGILRGHRNQRRREEL